MDINDYSYTPHMLDEDNEIASYTDYVDFGYLILSLEQWGCNSNEKKYVVSGFVYDPVDGSKDICRDFNADCSDGWETMRHGYEQAARYYNSLVPKSKEIPLF